MYNAVGIFSSSGMVNLGSVVITDQSRTGSSSAGVQAFASYGLLSDGRAVLSSNDASSTTISGEWQDPQGFAPGSDFDARATQSSGGPVDDGAALGTWLNLGTSRTWRIEVTDQFKTGTIFVEIRDAATQQILDSASITLSAQSGDLQL
jgi:hypothetical protein